ncbi:MAG: PD-(D/E)XK nuclease domain-containing protein [Bryobacterales bacterium]|nr:PD-(D/E)XK nuclease domain-containing protein [Bryobacterales bacterium]
MIDRFEGHYASVMYAYFAALGQDVRAEDSGSRGRADLTLRAGGQVYVFEFKIVERAGTGGRWRS